MGRASVHLSIVASQPIQLGGIDAGLTGTVRLHHVRVGDVLAARQIEFATAWQRPLQVSSIEITQPRLRLTLAPDGSLPELAQLRSMRRKGSGVASSTPNRPNVLVQDGWLEVTVPERGIAASGRLTAGVIPDGAWALVQDLHVAVSNGVPTELTFSSVSARTTTSGRLLKAVALNGNGHIDIADTRQELLDIDLGVGVPRSDFQSDTWLTGAFAFQGVRRPFSAIMKGIDKFQFEGNRLPLAWVPQLFGFDVNDANVSGTMDLEVAPVGLVMKPTLTIDSVRVAGDTTVASIQVQGSALLTHKRIESNLNWRVGELAGVLVASVARPLGNDASQVSLSLPTSDCAKALRSLPDALLGPSAGLTVAGEASAKIDIRYDPAASIGQGGRFMPAVDLSECRVLAEAPLGNPLVLRSQRMHTFPDGTQRTIGPGTATWTDSITLPSHVTGAFLAAEDARFFTHNGFDETQIGRSLDLDLRANRWMRGGSTITQQLVKNVFLSFDRTFVRKFQEAILTWRVEAMLDKQTILSNYLSIVELGPSVFGLHAAAAYWFGKAPAALTATEAAFLAALTAEPRSMTRRIQLVGTLDVQSKERILVVLRGMQRAGHSGTFVTPVFAQRALRLPNGPR